MRCPFCPQSLADMVIDNNDFTRPRRRVETKGALSW